MLASEKSFLTLLNVLMISVLLVAESAAEGETLAPGDITSPRWQRSKLLVYHGFLFVQ